MYLYLFYPLLSLIFVSGCQKNEINNEQAIKKSCLDQLEADLKKNFSVKTDFAFFVEETGTPMIELVRIDLQLPKKIQSLDLSRSATVEIISSILETINHSPDLQQYLLFKPFKPENVVVKINYDSRYPSGEAGFVGSNMIDGNIYNTWEYKPGLYPPESYEEAKKKS